MDHPARQGFYGIVEVFIDTIVICTATALVVIISGQWQDGSTGAVLTANAFGSCLPGSFGKLIVSIAITLFAYSTLLGWYWYGETAFQYVFGNMAVMPFRVLWIVCAFVGAISKLELLWLMADVAYGLMAIPNLISLLALAGTLVKLKDDFLVRQKQLSPSLMSSGAK